MIMEVLGRRLDLVNLEVFSKCNDSMIVAQGLLHVLDFNKASPRSSAHTDSNILTGCSNAVQWFVV